MPLERHISQIVAQLHKEAADCAFALLVVEYKSETKHISSKLGCVPALNERLVSGGEAPWDLSV
jgi:hypothetical protein